MSSVSNSELGGYLPYLAQYAVPPVAAGSAIVPAFRWFVIKSAHQLGDPVPSISAIEGIKMGLKVAPTISLIVGSQLVAQHIVEENMLKRLRIENQKFANFWKKVYSTMIVSAVSVPALVVFNGQTLKQTPKESLMKMTPRQAGAIWIREMTFLGSVRVSDEMGNAMKKVCGENIFVEYFAAFASGWIGAFFGHAPDTALTRWQKGKPVYLSSLLKGFRARGFGVGIFAVGYKFFKEEIFKQSR